MLDANALMERVGGGSDQVNLMELVKYLKESKLARKVSGFAEKTAETIAVKGRSIELSKRQGLTLSRGERGQDHCGEACVNRGVSPRRVVFALPRRRSRRRTSSPFQRGYSVGTDRYAKIYTSQPCRAV